MSERFTGVLKGLGELRLIPETELSTFVVGSAARGWNCDSSDLDLIVVSTDPMAGEQLLWQNVPLVPDALAVLPLTREGRRWEVKFWLDRQVDQLLAKVSWAAFEGDRKVGRRLSDEEELFLARLLTCVPLTGREWVLRRRRQLTESAFRAVVIVNALANSDARAETAMGKLAAGDVEAAVLSVRDAFGYAIDALLASHEEYGSVTKWRARRFRSAEPRLLTFDEYWSIETMRTYDPAKPQDWVKQVFALCKAVAADIEI